MASEQDIQAVYAALVYGDHSEWTALERMKLIAREAIRERDEAIARADAGPDPIDRTGEPRRPIVRPAWQRRPVTHEWARARPDMWKQPDHRLGCIDSDTLLDLGFTIEGVKVHTRGQYRWYYPACKLRGDAHRDFCQRKAAEVAAWPEDKRAASERAFGPTSERGDA